MHLGSPGSDESGSNDRRRAKIIALREEGTLHPAPQKIRDVKFQESEFCDPRDVHVKYEMLRRVSVEKASMTDVSDEYGVFRLTYYQAKADFEQAGISARSSRSSEQTGSWRSRRSEAESRPERWLNFQAFGTVTST